MRIAVVGFGDHARKNVLPVFEAMTEIEVVAIIVRDVVKSAEDFPQYASLLTTSLRDAIGDRKVDVVYIATPISTHYEIASLALDEGKDVWVEKPMTGALGDTKRLLEKAAHKGRFIGEVSMYLHHRQFGEIVKIIAEKAEKGERIITALARFSIPELDHDNIRYRKEAGGGALLDVGFYPLSAMAALFGTPQEVSGSQYFCPDRGVDLSGNALLAYDGFAAHCIWAIGSAYHNEMTISFETCTISIPRAFSKPAQLETEISILGNFGQPEDPIRIPADDHFRNIFSAFVGASRSKDIAVWETFARSALSHAKLIECLRICGEPN